MSLAVGTHVQAVVDESATPVPGTIVRVLGPTSTSAADDGATYVVQWAEGRTVLPAAALRVVT